MLKATPVADPVELAALCERKWREGHPHWETHGGAVLAKSDELRQWRSANNTGTKP
jgi:hypothetical protein